LAQGTGYQRLQNNTGNDGDQCLGGVLYLFTPSSTTYVKQWYAVSNNYYHNEETNEAFVAGYFNTTSAINAIDFKFPSGNINAGKIKMYGVT